MTVAQAIERFKFRMEDPNGDVWDDDDVIMSILDTNQTLSVKLLFDSGQFEYLKELQDSASNTLASGRMVLSTSSFFRLASVQRNSDKIFIPIKPLPAETPRSPMMQNDDLTEFAYYWNGYVYVHGGTNGVSYTSFWIDKPTTVDSNLEESGDFSVNEYVQELMLKLSQIEGWIIDNQPDRSMAIAKQLPITYGVKLDAI